MKENYIIDYISGNEIKVSPEEIEAVQPLAHILVEDYGYPKANILTHPQYRVKVRPSDNNKSYPVDIAVFNNDKKDEDSILLICECKSKSRKDGITQLQDYLRFSKAQLGMWYNGAERCYIRKFEQNGKVDFEEIPNIPRYGESVDSIGMLKRSQLRPTHNLKSLFRAIRNYLAANAVGVTRDEVLAQQLIGLIFCKIYDETWSAPDDTVQFRTELRESSTVTIQRIKRLFENVKRKYPAVFAASEEITLDSHSVTYVVGELQNYCIVDSERDVVADAFEVFIGHALKGGQGQFFTPRNIIRMMVNILDPQPSDYIIDPACGSGGFLIEVLRNIQNKLEEESKKYKWNTRILQSETDEAASHINGIDKDSFLAKVAKAYMAIFGYDKAGVFCEDSLDLPQNWALATKGQVALGKYNVLLTNPPFGSKIPVTGRDKLSQYDLAKKWKFNKKKNVWEAGKLQESESPQVLFIERDLDLLANYGRMAIVLPDGIFGNDNFGYIRHWLSERGRILAIVDIPVETFQPNTATKTSVLFFQKLPKEEIPKDYDIFMAIARTCGHDRRGKEIDSDEIQLVADAYKEWYKDHMGVSK